jgi:hypothetical protein
VLEHIPAETSEVDEQAGDGDGPERAVFHIPSPDAERTSNAVRVEGLYTRV